MIRYLIFALLSPSLMGAQTKILVIGDSLSAEYQYSTPFSAPDLDPLNANTLNWIEILVARRSAEIDFGSKATFYPDIRAAGYKYNWGVPGAETEFWEDVFEANILSGVLLWNSKLTLLEDLHEVDVAVIFLGGNDVNKIYSNLYNDTPPENFPTAIIDRYTGLLQTLRNERPDLPLILVNVPDIGVTPDVQEDHPAPEKRGNASQHINTLNSEISTIAQTFDAQVVDVFGLTSDVIAADPYFIGSQQMIKSYNSENPSNYLFCKRKFHPTSGLNAQIANAILEVINSHLGTELTLIPNREIISDILGRNPDQVFLDWASGYPDATASLSSDDDGDQLTNLIEFALGTNPTQISAPSFFERGPTNWQFRFKSNPDAIRYIKTIAEESTNLSLWIPSPDSRLNTLPDNTIEVNFPDSKNLFIRLRFSLEP